MIYGRIAKMMVRGKICFVEFWRPTRELMEQDSIILQRNIGFKEWTGDVQEVENIYALNRQVHVLNMEEAQREKTVIDHVAESLYHVERAIRTSEQIILTLREAHLNLTGHFAEMQNQHKKELAALTAELDRYKIEVGEEPTGGWDEWAKHQKPVDSATEKRIDEALGIVRNQ